MHNPIGKATTHSGPVRLTEAAETGCATAKFRIFSPRAAEKTARPAADTGSAADEDDDSAAEAEESLSFAGTIAPCAAQLYTTNAASASTTQLPEPGATKL